MVAPSTGSVIDRLNAGGGAPAWLTGTGSRQPTSTVPEMRSSYVPGFSRYSRSRYRKVVDFPGCSLGGWSVKATPPSIPVPPPHAVNPFMTFRSPPCTESSTGGLNDAPS
jgi:hypothetical protein